jgi:CheY-like chemotaxis protein
LATGEAEGMELRVLIVDDSASFSAAARDLLARQGLDVLELASTIAEALGHVSDLQPDVILVDINLGGESGFDFARRMAEDGHGRSSSVILMSSHAEADFADLIAENDAVGFLAKSELSADAIRGILEQRTH